MTDERLEFLTYTSIEYDAWRDVMAELEQAGVAAINGGEPFERLHDAIVRWAEELVQLRLHDPDPEHAERALEERREAYERWPKR